MALVTDSYEFWMLLVFFLFLFSLLLFCFLYSCFDCWFDYEYHPSSNGHSAYENMTRTVSALSMIKRFYPYPKIAANKYCCDGRSSRFNPKP